MPESFDFTKICVFILSTLFSFVLDPNDLYGSEHDNIKAYDSKQKKTKKENKVHPIKMNGVATENGNSNNNETFLHVGPKRSTMKGDAFMYGEAKVNRDRKLRENLLKREQMAKVSIKPITVNVTVDFQGTS